MNTKVDTFASSHLTLTAAVLSCVASPDSDVFDHVKIILPFVGVAESASRHVKPNPVTLTRHVYVHILLHTTNRIAGPAPGHHQ